jgi:hypothetical protein
MYNDPFLRPQNNTKYSNFCPCGINATGDEAEPIAEESVNKKVVNLQAWRYARLGLVLVGSFVVVNWLMRKLIHNAIK